MTRPDGVRLAFLEAVLRALAETTDDDFDSGRWTRRVETAGGPVDVRLALPRLLDALAGESASAPTRDLEKVSRVQPEQLMRAVRKAIEARGAASVAEVQSLVGSIMSAAPDSGVSLDPTTPVEEAQDLAYAAMNATGRYQIQLARRALAISRDCADAWAILAGRATSADEAIALHREAVAAGERALGSKYFDAEAGHFWGLVETRPYMRARFALAEMLDDEGQLDEAVTHYRELLRLNPGDNQGARYRLLPLLLEQDRDAEARALVDQLKEDEGAAWLYAGALVAFRLQQEDANSRLDRALTANRHVPPFLTGEKAIPGRAVAYQLGSVEEATIAANLLVEAWNETPGAIFWLNTRRRLPKAPGRKRRPGRAG